MLLFKVAGLLILFLICCAVGFSKAYNLKKREEKLNTYYRSIDLFSMRIRTENGDTEKLLPLCFKESEVFLKDGKICYNKSFLNDSDKNLLCEFFSDFGQRSREDEYERTRLFCDLLKKQYLEALEDSRKLCKLYGTVGVLCGIFICIFFL